MNTFEIVRLIGNAPKELLNSIENHLLTRMAFIGDRNGKNIKCSTKVLIHQTKLSRSTIIRCLGSLIKKKVLILSSTRIDGNNDMSCYEIDTSVLRDKKVIENNSIKLANEVTVTVKQLSTWCHTDTPPGVTQTPPPVSHRHPLYKKPSVTQTQTWCHTDTPPGVTQTPLPYTPIFKPIHHQPLVELDANSTISSLQNSSSKKISKKKQSWKIETEEIFRHWQKVLNHPRSKLDKKRNRLINSALENGYTVEELKKAIDGIKKWPFYMGDNDRGEIYDGLHVIFRNSEFIEKFIRNFDSPVAPKNKNVSTGLKKAFHEKNREQVEILREVTAKYFPQHKDWLSSEPKKENLKNELE